MIYQSKDLEVLKTEIEFIDTAVIPVVNIDMNGLEKRHSSDLELIQILIIQLEKQLKGRLFITPQLSVVNGDLNLIDSYKEQLNNYGFKNIITMSTFDIDKNTEHIKINHIPMDDLSNDMKMDMTNEELKVVMRRIIEIWNR